MPQPAVTSAADHSQVLVFPPVIPLSGFLLGVLLETIWPLSRLVSLQLRAILRPAGLGVLVVGAAGFAWMVATMKRARTPINNYRTPAALVEDGPFRFTRNPMYLFGATAYAGLALVLTELWSLALLPLVLIVTHYGVVLREEAGLERRFGAAYLGYKARVRRWL